MHYEQTEMNAFNPTATKGIRRPRVSGVQSGETKSKDLFTST